MPVLGEPLADSCKGIVRFYDHYERNEGASCCDDDCDSDDDYKMGGQRMGDEGFMESI